MTNMANILRNVIRNGGMPLAQVNERIETMYLNGRINAEERLELTELMHSKADPSNEAGDYKALYEALTKKYNELEARVKTLEEKLTADDGGTDDEAGEGTADEYEQWEPWDGVSDKYQPGAMVTHNGKVYESVYAAQNVWEPGAPGIDERYWVIVEQ